MANFTSTVGFDLNAVNMNTLITNQTGFAFNDNVFQSYEGKVYEDVVVFEYFDGGALKAFFGGSGVVFDQSGAVVAGTATGFVQQQWDGLAWTKAWQIDSFTFSAVTLGNAIVSSGTADDGAVLSSVLSGNDTIRLSAFADVMRGFSGNDAMFGFAGNDNLQGDAGNDTLNGGSGADTLLGGSGNDTYVVDNTGDKIFETTTTLSGINAGGTDTVLASVSFSLNSTGASFVENLRLNSANAINGTGNALNNTIFAGAGNNIIDGLGGTSDTVSYALATGAVAVDLRNTTTAQATASSGFDLIRNVENVAGSNFGDTLRGNDAANILTGNGDADTLQGFGGNDLLRGGAGSDDLTGGAGQDKFRFDTALGTPAAPNIDHIMDFVVADDTIQLENSIFTAFGTTTIGAISASTFAINTTGLAADADDHIIYESDTGNLFYDANGSAAGGSVQIALLGANLSLTNADFVLV